MNDEPGNVETLTLERFRYALQMQLDKRLSDELANLPEVNIQLFDSIVERLVISLRGFVWGYEAESVTTYYPADWKEAVKERFAPDWFIERWPVRYKHIEIKANAVYPKLKMPGAAVSFVATERTDGAFVELETRYY